MSRDEPCWQCMYCCGQGVPWFWRPDPTVEIDRESVFPLSYLSSLGLLFLSHYPISSHYPLEIVEDHPIEFGDCHPIGIIQLSWLFFASSSQCIPSGWPDWTTINGKEESSESLEINRFPKVCWNWLMEAYCAQVNKPMDFWWCQMILGFQVPPCCQHAE